MKTNKQKHMANMKNQKIYMATRSTSNDVAEKLNKDSVSVLNRKLSNNLGSAAIKKGIKKTEGGKRLNFIIVDEKELNKLMGTEIHPLLKVDGEKLSEALQKVNSSYPSRLNRDQHKQYKKELKQELVNSIEVIGEDKGIKRETVSENPYKKGDWIQLPTNYGIRIGSYVGRVSKVTEKSYWYEVPVLLDKNGEEAHITNYNYAKIHFDGVEGYCNGQDGAEWVVPYEGNEDKMVFTEPKMKRVTKSDIKYPKTVDENERGFKHEYTRRD